jgi:hypothetical protein
MVDGSLRAVMARSSSDRAAGAWRWGPPHIDEAGGGAESGTSSVLEKQLLSGLGTDEFIDDAARSRSGTETRAEECRS